MNSVTVFPVTRDGFPHALLFPDLWLQQTACGLLTRCHQEKGKASSEALRKHPVRGLTAPLRGELCKEPSPGRSGLFCGWGKASVNSRGPSRPWMASVIKLEEQEQSERRCRGFQNGDVGRATTTGTITLPSACCRPQLDPRRPYIQEQMYHMCSQVGRLTDASVKCILFFFFKSLSNV